MALADTAKLIAALELQDKFSATAAKFDKTISGMERRTSTLSRIGNEAGRGAQAAATNVARIGVLAAGAITSQVVLGVKSLEHLATVTNQTEAAIESTGGVANVTAEQVRALSESLEDLSTVDDKVIQEGANILLTFKKVRNEVGEGNDVFNQAVDAANNLAIAGFGDMTTTAKQLGKALNDPIRGVSALRRVGVQLTEQQEDQIKTFVESGQTLKAQKVILEELESQVGKSGEAFGKGPGAAMRRFGDAVEGAQQSLAVGFLPLIEKVSARVQEILGNPEVQAQIRKFGEGAAGSIDDLINVASKLPWGAIGDAFRVMGTGSKALLDAFTSLPSWVQTAVLTGWGLNKLTGGALGNIVGELGKGLIKGVLNMNAAVVNINAKAVTGGPGGLPTGGRGGGGFLGNLGRGLAVGTGVGLAATAGVMTVDFVGKASAQLTGVLENLNALNRGTVPEINESLAKVEAAQQAANKDIVTTLVSNASGLNRALDAEAAELRGAVHTLNASEGNRHSALLSATQSQHAQRLAAVHTLNASEGARAAAAHARLDSIRGEQSAANAKLEVIKNKRSSVNVGVTVNATTNVAFSATAAAVQLARVSQTLGTDFRQDIGQGTL